MRLVRQFRVNPLHVVIVHEVVQLSRRTLSSVARETPHSVGDFEIVVVVVSRIQRLVELIVRHRVKVRVVDPAPVLPVDYLPHQPEIRFHLIGRQTQPVHEIEIQHVRRVQPDAVYIKFLHPEPDDVTDIVLHLRIPLVEPRQQVVAAPVAVGEAVVVLVVSAEVDVHVPVPVPGRFPVFLQIAEGEEIPPRVIEDAVEDHMYSLLMAGRDEFGQIVVRAKAGIQLPVIRCVVAVAAGLKKRSDIKRRAADGRDVVDPGKQRTQPVHRLAVVVLFRCACQSKRINMVENSFIIPCHVSVLLVCLCPIIRVPLRERKAEPSPALGHS